jgi:hypothetical protein
MNIFPYHFQRSLVWRYPYISPDSQVFSALFMDDQRQIHHQVKNYLIIGDTLYHHGVDSILHRCLTHEEAESMLNDFHSGACGGHLSGLETTQKILRVRVLLADNL